MQSKIRAVKNRAVAGLAVFHVSDTILGTAKPSILGIEKPLVLGTRKPLHTCKLSEESLHSYDSIWLPFADAGAVCVTWLTIANLTPFCHRFSEGDAGDLEVA